jgi:integrase
VHDETVPPTIRINKAWKKNPGGPPIIGVTKSRRGRRTVSVWPELIALLGDRGRPGELVFRGVMSGNQIWYGPFNSRIWRPAVERAAIEKRPNIHDLRHTGASWLIADGSPLPYIQARLGHESITVTVNTYGHLLPDAHTSMAASLRGTLSEVLGLDLLDRDPLAALEADEPTNELLTYTEVEGE